jgi:hypothetical protein
VGSLKTRYNQIVFLVVFSLFARGQRVELPYSAASICRYAGNLYCFGLEENNKKLQFSIQQLGKNLEKLSLKNYPIAILKSEDMVACWSDTLHGFLNVYVSEGKNQTVSVFRFNKKFELINQSSGIEVSRLNALSGFDNELFYDREHVYAIKTKRDSSGVQFYLNKYTAKESTGGFEYNLIWQFPFERKNISSARVFHANKDVVFMYVVVNAGEKTGQWVLKINAKNGYLIKGTKLNGKVDENTYCFGNYYFDAVSKNLLIWGHKFNSKQFNPKTELLSASGQSLVTLYLSELDSIGDQVLKQELKLPIAPTKTTGKPSGYSYLLQINKVRKTAFNEFKLDIDVYKNTKAAACYTFANSFTMLFKKEDENYLYEKKTIASEPFIETYLFNNDKLDMNGKLCQDSSTSFYKLFYKQPSLAVKLNVSEDSLKRPVWLLSKSNIRKGSINYSSLKAGKKTYELKTVEELPKSFHPACIPLHENEFVIGRQTEATLYKIVTYKN